MSDMDPESAAEFALKTGEDAAGAAADTAQNAAGVTDSPVIKGLLSTQPESNPNTPLEYFLSGLKKFANGAVDAGLNAGTTAAEDFIRGTFGALQGGGDNDNQDNSVELGGPGS